MIEKVDNMCRMALSIEQITTWLGAVKDLRVEEAVKCAVT